MSSNSLNSSASLSQLEEGIDTYSNYYVSSTTSKIKTQLCRAYIEGGVCKFGDYCKFAHGWHEIRCLSEHDKPARKKCYGYWRSNECKYGLKCKFEHHKPDWTSKLILRMHNQKTGQSRLLNILNGN